MKKAHHAQTLWSRIAGPEDAAGIKKWCRLTRGCRRLVLRAPSGRAAAKRLNRYVRRPVITVSRMPQTITALTRMEYFDLYRYGGTDSAAFFNKPINVGEKVWLDGIDGFFDQYFDQPPELIRFVAVDNPLALPRSQADFEALPFLEAKVLTHQTLGGEVQVVRASTLGQWARAIPLPTELRLSDLSLANQPSHEVFDSLFHKAKLDQWAIWTTTAKHRKSLEDTSAIYVFVTDTDTRCIIVCK